MALVESPRSPEYQIISNTLPENQVENSDHLGSTHFEIRLESNMERIDA